MQEANAQTLHVVARELNSTLGDARAALEASLDRPGDSAPLELVSDLLRQARGVLRVVEVYGGALLAEEMQLTAHFLARGCDARQQAEGLDALMRAAVQLPTYLERVFGGGRDLALVLLPLLNDLRAIRGASLLSEGTLLSLNLKSEQMPRGRETGYEHAELTVAQLARRLRPRFQVALLGLIRGEHGAAQLEILADVAERIEAAATTGPTFQLWWVVGAVIEALRANGLPESASIKRLLGHADRELRRLYELGEQTYAESPPFDLLNNLLFYVARATTDGARVAAVRSSFRLAELLPADETVEQEQESLSGPSVKLMHTVAAAIREDLTRVKDALDLFTRKGGQPEELGPQVEMLRKIGDTLAVLGLGSLREHVQAELGRLSSLVARNIPAERDTLIGIAAALISVEDSLDDALVQLIMPPGAPLAGVIQDPEFRQVAEAVLRECSVNLARIKELVAQALEPGSDVVGMDAVTPLARGVTAGLLMLGKTRAMDIMDRTCRLMVGLLRPGAGRPPQRVVDRLADALVGIEYYMETLQAGRGDPWYMLDNAERCLAFVEARAAGPAEAAAPAAPEEAPAGPEAGAAPEFAATVPEGIPPVERTLVIERPADLARLALPDGWRETVPAGALVAEPASEERPAEVPAAAAAEPGPAAPAERPAMAADHLDTELLDIFIEEAREEIDVIGRLFPLWQENSSDRESLIRVRRAFHTLKGSGRMVGAMALGEFAWSLENLLNRVIDGTRERSPDVVATVREAVAAMPRLVDAVERREALPPGTEAFIARIHAVAAGEEAPAEPVRAPVEQAPAYEPTVMIATLDEATMARMLQGVPPVTIRGAVPEEVPPVAEPEESPAAAAVEPVPPEAGAVAEAGAPEAGAVAEAGAPGEAAAVEEELPEPAMELEPEPFAAMDPSLQDIFRKEVQTHLEVFRDYLRKSWVTIGPHYVTEDLYRACHTLRGASRTAESEECIRLSDPLHRWLRRLFDADRPFDDEGLAMLADAVVAFEDIVESTVSRPAPPAGLADVIGRIVAIDLALEQLIAREKAEPPPSVEPAVPEEPPAATAAEVPAEAPFDIEHLIPEIAVEPESLGAAPGAGYERLLPAQPGEGSVAGEVPYLSPPEPAETGVEEPVASAEPGAAPGPEEAQPVPVLPLPSVIEEVARAEAMEAVPEPGEREVDYDADIAAIFSEEATELLEAADGALGALRAERGSRDQVVELQRALHTIKGGARMAGIRAMGDLSHELESLLTQVGVGSVPLEDRTFEVLQASLDELSRMRDFVNAGRAVKPARDLVTRIQLVARGATPSPAIEPLPPPAAAPVEAEPAPEPPTEPEPTLEGAEEPGPTAMAPAEADTSGAQPQAPEHEAAEPRPAGAPPSLPGREAAGERAEMARVDADLLDAMLNNAGEVSIYRARIEQQLSSVDFNLAELARVVQRLKDQLRKLEIETEAQILHRHVDQAPRRTDFDPLELDRYSAIQQYSRALGETASDVASIQGLLGNLTREAQNLLTQQGRIVTDLQDGLMRTRMVPFQRHAQRLTRIVRQAAAESGKRADLVVEGAAGEIDRQVLDRMLPPLEHLVRNAVVHGIERPVERLEHGKPETGRISLTLRREGSEVVITVADDGAGINLRAVREKAAALGIVPPKQELSDEQAKQLILEPGFTTAGRVTQAAGRGVGMDVVATEVKKLGGALFIDSEEGRGARFTVRLPFTLAISQALVVRAGEEFFALPLPTIEGVVRVPAVEVQRQLAGDAAGFEYGGQLYRFQHLSGFVGNEPVPPAEHDPAVPVILVRAGEHSTGIVTDELIGSREIVVKTVGPQISGIRGISGATILGDGRICIILDVGALVRSDWRVTAPPERPQRQRADERVFALVVDDSITVRRVTQRLLERNGMRVMTAKDGLDAIGVLQDHVPDVILLDIEMPRMDGYEVASHVRNDPRLKDVPIIMITSRVGEKHRARAIELGVNDYLGKPYQETQLLQALEPLLQRRQAS